MRLRLAFVLIVIAFFVTASPGSAQLSCTAPDPANRPAPAQQWFMIIIDTSASMTIPVLNSNGVPIQPSCGYPADRFGHARCAVKNTVNAFSDRADFGLAQFPTLAFGVTQPCFGNPNVNCYQSEFNTRGSCSGCGPRPGDATTAAGAKILVPINSNPATVVQYVDNNCTNPEVGPPIGATPLNGALRDMQRYFASHWTAPDGTQTFNSPLLSNTLSCRHVNVILLTDGDETCDQFSDAVAAAGVLFNTGVTVGGVTYKVRTYVINFAGGDISQTDQIAAAGGTGASLFATNETQLTQAFNQILTPAKETLNGKDDDCNGCTDDGISQLTIQKAFSRDLVRQDSDVDYSITVTNAGPTFAALTLTDPLPFALKLNSFSAPAGWTCTTPALGSSGTISCSNPSLELNVPAVFTGSVHVSASTTVGTTIVNKADLTASFGASPPLSATDSVQVIANQPPLANAGPNQSLAVGTSCTADVQLDGTASQDPEHDPLTYTWSRTGAPDVTGAQPVVTLSPGLYTFTLTVDDGHGGSATATVLILVTDTIAPTITAPPDITADSSAGACSTTVSVGTPTATDNCGSPTITRTPAGGIFPVGTTSVVWTATDAAGHKATATQNVTVRDKTAPSLTAPGSVNVATAPDATGCAAIVSDQQLGTPSASDDCGGTVNVTRSGVPSGNAFGVGTTTVTYTAVDAAGNSTTKTQIVTVVDGTNPRVSAPPDVNAQTGPADTTCGTIVPNTVLGSATATDNCPGVTVARSGVPAGNLFPAGTTTITFTATDAAGNSSTATQKVTVTDHTPPVITLSGANPLTLSCRAPFVDPGATANDNCDGDLTSSITRSGSVDATTTGTYTVNYTVTDAAGNSTTTPRTVIVLDDAPPVISSASVTPSELWPANHKMVPIAVQVAASDACSGSATCSIQSVRSNEPVNGLGDGDQSPDWIISGMSLSLRAERSGTGTGRTYTITIRCVDGAGQASSKTLIVTVPHDK